MCACVWIYTGVMLVAPVFGASVVFGPPRINITSPLPIHTYTHSMVSTHHRPLLDIHLDLIHKNSNLSIYLNKLFF